MATKQPQQIRLFDLICWRKHSAIDATNNISNNDNNNEVELSSSFVQCVGDNVDHNLVTLTEKGTFHGMGIISANTTSNSMPHVIKRLTIHKKVSDFSKDQGIPIHPYTESSKHGLLKFKPSPSWFSN